MIRISMQALMRILVSNKIVFVTTKSKQFDSRLVLKFLVDKTSETFPSLAAENGDTLDAAKEDRILCKGTDPLLWYDLENQSVIACQLKICELIKNARSKAKDDAHVKTPQTVSQST